MEKVHAAFGCVHNIDPAPLCFPSFLPEILMRISIPIAIVKVLVDGVGCRMCGSHCDGHVAVKDQGRQDPPSIKNDHILFYT